MNPYAPPTSTAQDNAFKPLPLNLNIKMKLLDLSPQFYLSDLHGRQVGFIRQKLFKLKEAIELYTDESKTTLRYKIDADRIMDFSANYHFFRSKMV